MSSFIIDNIINHEVSSDDKIFNNYDFTITIILDKYNYNTSLDDLSKQFNLGLYTKKTPYELASVLFVYNNSLSTNDKIIFELSNILFNNISNDKLLMTHIKNKNACIKVITNQQKFDSMEIKYNFRFYVPLTIRRAWDSNFSHSIPVFMIYK